LINPNTEHECQSKWRDLEEKKLLGSGGYAFAKLTEQEETKVNLGVPQIF
jgi:hypothetical protein